MSKQAKRIIESTVPPLVAAVCFSFVAVFISWLEPQLKSLLWYFWVLAMCAFGFVAVLGALLEASTSGKSDAR